MISREEHPLPWTLEKVPYSEAELWDIATELEAMHEPDEPDASYYKREQYYNQVLQRHHYACRSARDITIITNDDLRDVLCRLLAAETCSRADGTYDLLFTLLHRACVAVSLAQLGAPAVVRAHAVDYTLSTLGRDLLDHLNKNP